MPQADDKPLNIKALRAEFPRLPDLAPHLRLAHEQAKQLIEIDVQNQLRVHYPKLMADWSKLAHRIRQLEYLLARARTEVAPPTRGSIDIALASGPGMPGPDDPRWFYHADMLAFAADGLICYFYGLNMSEKDWAVIKDDFEKWEEAIQCYKRDRFEKARDRLDWYEKLDCPDPADHTRITGVVPDAPQEEDTDD